MRTSVYLLAAAGLCLTLASCRQLDDEKSRDSQSTEATTPAVEATGAPGPTVGATPNVTDTLPAGAEDPAATVDGVAVPMDAFRKLALDTQRFYVEQGLDPNTEQGQQELLRLRRQVLDDMINQVLIEAAAKELGITVSEEEVEAGLQTTIAAAGGEAKFQDSLTTQQATVEEVREMERASLIGRKVQEKVTADLAATAEAVRARHILCETESACQEALSRLQAGEDFAAVAKAVSVDKATAERGGDLDWVLRGLLPSKAVEAAILAVPVGERSAVVHTDFGYHVIEVLERDPARPLSEEQRIDLRQRYLAEWLKERRAQANIVILVPDLKDMPSDG